MNGKAQYTSHPFTNLDQLNYTFKTSFTILENMLLYCGCQLY
jgi:hypothetical protein